MGSGPNGWLLDYGLMDEVHASDLIWAPQFVTDQSLASCGVGLDFSYKEEKCFDETSSRKRAHVESKAEPGSKACREKMRRDRLNDRFVELCSILDPGRPPKSDRIIILSDATRLLNQLCNEAKNLKQVNESLQDTIKIMKIEKSELRDEKVRLKSEKDNLEQVLKGMSVPPTFMPQTSAVFHTSAAFAGNNKAIPSYVVYPPTTMWQWMPPAALDTSQDHMLRPPVA